MTFAVLSLVNQANTTPPTAHRRHPLSRGARWTLGVLGLLVLAIAVCEIAGWPFLRGPVERKLTESLGRQVQIGDGFRVRFIGSLRVRADTLAVAPPEWDTGKTDPSPFVDAKDAYLKVPYSTLWRLYRKSDQPIHIAALEVGDLQARILREASGRANWTMKEEDPNAPKTATPVPTFDSLVLKSGHVVFDDAVSAIQFDAVAQTREGTGAAEQRASASSSAPAPAAAASVASASSAAQAASGNDSAEKAAANKPADPDAPGLFIEGKGKYKNNPITFNMSSDGVLPLLASDTSKTTVKLMMEARAGRSRVKFDGRALDVMKFTGVDGAYEVEGPSLAAIGDALGLTLPTTAEFAVAGTLKKDGKVWTTDVKSLSVGSTKLDGRFKFDQNPQVPVLSGELNGSNLAMKDLAPAVGGDGAKKPAGKEAKPAPGSKVLPDRDFDIPSLKMMNADVKVRLAKADLGTPLLDALAPLQGDLTLQDGVLSLDNLLARTAGGTLAGSVKLDSTPAQPKFGTDLRWSGVKLEQWLNLGNPRDEKARAGGKPPPYITGDAIGRARLSGTGKSTSAILGSLDGTVSNGIRNGTISHLIVEAVGLDVAQGIGMLFKGDDSLALNCALVQLSAKNGVAHTDVGIIDTNDTTMLITGNVSLADETLGLKLTAKPKDMSPLSLRAPLNVTGTFASPKVFPEVKTLSVKLLGSAVLALINPIAAVIPLVDLGDKGNQASCLEAVNKLGGDSAARQSLPPARPATPARKAAARS